MSSGCRMCVILSLVKLLNANCRHVLQTVGFLDESYRDLLTSMLPNALMHWSLRNVYNICVNTFCPQASYFVYFLLGMIVNLFIHSFTHSLTHSFIHLFIHSFTHSLTHSFIHLFIHSFIVQSNIKAVNPQSPKLVYITNKHFTK